MRLLRQPGFLISALIVLIALVAVFFPHLFASQDPFEGTARDKLQAPSGAHWFGTDNLGRDLYSRVVHGAFLSLATAGLAVLVGVVAGAVVGLLSGFIGGRLDFVLMRIVDVLIAVPSVLLALIVVAGLGFGPVPVALGVGLGAAGSFARVTRAQVVRVRGEEYVEAARTLGVRWPAILVRHVFPNSARPVIALAALEIGTAILAVSALSFLGFGAPPPAPEWGALVSAGRDFLATGWWLSVLPGAVILVVVLAVNRLARAIGGER
ncbi:ABC transporter permease [Herbiconiux sp. L3-i23]|uniref:ABC transporter permease n=1 Tax=Herbiconiux sp. L3-i23 TaxID=2905871 RepID=UPI002069AF44|nr:ABC transporter permease [Herbiconiux sp. L3-i23]BDI23517.1 ABC transporter permease [Herbiconiux sp. L3-i23]